MRHDRLAPRRNIWIADVTFSVTHNQHVGDTDVISALFQFCNPRTIHRQTFIESIDILHPHHAAVFMCEGCEVQRRQLATLQHSVK